MVISTSKTRTSETTARLAFNHFFIHDTDNNDKTQQEKKKRVISASRNPTKLNAPNEIKHYGLLNFIVLSESFHYNASNLLNATLKCIYRMVEQLSQMQRRMPDWTIEGIISIMFFGKAKGIHAICSLKP